jgi:hypothetical protein
MKTKYKITLEVSGEAKENIMPILETFQKMGKLGSSRVIRIEEYGNYYFDGDGSSKIYDIKLEKIEELNENEVKYQTEIKQTLGLI